MNNKVDYLFPGEDYNPVQGIPFEFEAHEILNINNRCASLSHLAIHLGIRDIQSMQNKMGLKRKKEPDIPERRKTEIPSVMKAEFTREID